LISGLFFKGGDILNIKDLKGVGPKVTENLKSLGIYTLGDALYYYPRSYEDRENVKPINNVVDGEFAAFEVEVKLIIPAKKTFSRKCVNKIIFKNDSGNITGVWFNQPYIKNNFKVGEKLSIWGKVSKSNGIVQIIDPQYEKNVDNTTLRINPIYPINKNISQKILRKIIKQALEHIDDEVIDIFPEGLKKVYGIPDIKMALINIHFPPNNEILNISRFRMKFEELLILQLCLFMSKMDYLNTKLAQSVKISSAMIKIKEALPFELTGAQARTVREMLKDMKKTTPMNRLVQGDVGSGKTIIAIIGLINSAMNGFQGAMMAPTEILAEQHYASISSFTQSFNLKIAIITGSTSIKEKKEILQGIKSGEINIVIGTHALIQENVEFYNLALVITDEQHRFGVRQRAKLINKGNNPHVLVMTATPIPRTLALFVYGDMDISIIDELPPGRKKIDTYYLHPTKKDRIYNFIKKEIANGRQAYVVCPLVEESEKLNAESVIETAENIKALYFQDYSVTFLHGKMSSKEKDEIMKNFKNGSIDVLVSTTVIEVGVNVPNASVMVIENAERFGLAQLHQLRGRVGRGEYKSYCVLITGVQSKECLERMKIMSETNDGFKIADKDMQLRGTGEFFGFRQSGMPELKMADIIQDIEIVKKTRDLARELIDSGDINSEPYKAIKHIVNKFFEEKADEITFN
jgi:ATP-dependent DNA helicase RecG